MGRTVVVIAAAGSEFGEQFVPESVNAADLVIAADSGLDLAERLGIKVDAVVGDLDSVSPSALAAARERGTVVEVSPAEKDQTDLELALAFGQTPDHLVVLGGDGGRLDHLLCNIAVLAGALCPVEAWFGTTLVVPVRTHWHSELAEGTTLSVIPWASAPTVSIAGVKYPLDHERLAVDAARGVSNQSIGGMVRVDVHDGQVLVVIPEAGGI